MQRVSLSAPAPHDFTRQSNLPNKNLPVHLILSSYLLLGGPELTQDVYRGTIKMINNGIKAKFEKNKSMMTTVKC